MNKNESSSAMNEKMSFLPSERFGRDLAVASVFMPEGFPLDFMPVWNLQAGTNQVKRG
jgi:hypothetical protein